MHSKNKKKTNKTRDFSTSNFLKDKNYVKLKKLYSKLKKTYKFSPIDLISELEKKEILISINIFNKNLSALETICKYLKENLKLKNKEISSLTGRSEKSVWQAYNSSLKKFHKKLIIKISPYYFPISILKKPKLSILETIVFYLKDQLDLSYHEIATHLKRDDRTIWTVYQRARKKYVSK